MIRIVKVPRGEAPEEVRRAWVGLELPLMPGHPHGPPDIQGSQGVVTMRESAPFQGWSVWARDAIDILAKSNSEAANWWKGTEWYSRDDAILAFREDECELIGEFPKH